MVVDGVDILPLAVDGERGGDLQKNTCTVYAHTEAENLGGGEGGLSPPTF